MTYCCKWCGGNRRRKTRRLRERMFGDGTAHDYEECDTCGSLQLCEPLPDLAPFYPANYGAHGAVRQHGMVWSNLRRLRARLARVWPFPPDVGLAAALQFPAVILQLQKILPRDRRARILDVGCGSGHALLHLADLGYRSLTGFDPFVDEDLHYPNGVTVWKQTLAEHAGAYDFIMSHHAVEHMPAPADALGEMRRLLAPGGRIAIRVPVVGGAAWQEYGDHWVQLDPPRHVTIPTEAGFRALSARQGFVVTQVRYDSSGFQFWGSEYARRGLSLIDTATGRGRDRCKDFSEEERRRWEERAAELNRSGAGDQALFVLESAPPKAS